MCTSFDSDDFCIRIFGKVAYLKVKGMQNEEAALFFARSVDQVLDGYPHSNLAALCDLKDLIISTPSVGRIINNAIRKVTYRVNFEYNGVLVNPKFGQIIRAYIFSFYLRDTKLKTHICSEEEKVIKWLESKGYDLDELKVFLKK